MLIMNAMECNVLVVLCIGAMTAQSQIAHKCEKNSFDECRDISHNNETMTLPNLLGHETIQDVEVAFELYRPLINANCSHIIRQFLCSIVAPPCMDARNDGYNTLMLCPGTCEKVRDECIANMEGFYWPDTLECGRLTASDAEHYCTNGTMITSQKNVTAVEELSSNSTNTHERNDCIPVRTFNFTDDTMQYFFAGWADVQGTGAANDYCRVVKISKKKKILKCTLAGKPTTNYTSPKKFRPGVRNTWFMRDMDSDGRDDYCRCILGKNKEGVWCMKAGEQGFYGGPGQKGSQYTFQIPNPLPDHPCYKVPVDPQFGLPYKSPYK